MLCVEAILPDPAAGRVGRFPNFHLPIPYFFGGRIGPAPFPIRKGGGAEVGVVDQPLVERDAPLAELESLAWMAASGTGHAVFITGEAGARKTTLLRAFEARAGGARVLHSACEDLSTPAPLGPLRDLAQEPGADLDALIRDEADRLAVFGRVLSLAEAPDRATVLAIEDRHWADEATLDFVRFAARRIRDRPLLLVVTASDDETGAQRSCAGRFGACIPPT
jgi:predicted ATPase